MGFRVGPAADWVRLLRSLQRRPDRCATPTAIRAGPISGGSSAHVSSYVDTACNGPQPAVSDYGCPRVKQGQPGGRRGDLPEGRSDRILPRQERSSNRPPPACPAEAGSLGCETDGLPSAGAPARLGGTQKPCATAWNKQCGEARNEQGHGRLPRSVRCGNANARRLRLHSRQRTSRSRRRSLASSAFPGGASPAVRSHGLASVRSPLRGGAICRRAGAIEYYPGRKGCQTAPRRLVRLERKSWLPDARPSRAMSDPGRLVRPVNPSFPGSAWERNARRLRLHSRQRTSRSRRRSLASSAFPGGAWERGGAICRRAQRSNTTPAGKIVKPPPAGLSGWSGSLGCQTDGLPAPRPTPVGSLECGNSLPLWYGPRAQRAAHLSPLSAFSTSAKAAMNRRTPKAPARAPARLGGTRNRVPCLEQAVRGGPKRTGARTFAQIRAGVGTP